MQKLDSNLTQRERFAIELKKISEDVTAADRAAFIKEYNVTPGNLSQYLNGKVFDNDKAALILSFFKARIEKREEVLK